MASILYPSIEKVYCSYFKTLGQQVNNRQTLLCSQNLFTLTVLILISISFKRFGYLVYNCRNKKMKVEGKLVPQNKFKMITSRVMQYRVREEVKVRRQETIEKVRCFRYWKIRHYK